MTQEESIALVAQYKAMRAAPYISLVNTSARRVEEGRRYDDGMVIRDKLMRGFVDVMGWVISKRYDGIEALQGTKFNRRGNSLQAPYSDHGSVWRIGRRVNAVIEQPYPLTPVYLQEMRDWAKRQGVVMSEPDWPSWWYPGVTKLIVFTRGGDVWPFTNGSLQ